MLSLVGWWWFSRLHMPAASSGPSRWNSSKNFKLKQLRPWWILVGNQGWELMMLLWFLDPDGLCWSFVLVLLPWRSACITPHLATMNFRFLMVSPEVKDWIHRISIVWWRESTPFWTAIPGQSSRIWSQETRGWNRYRYSRCPCWKSLKNLAVCQTLPLMLILVHLDSKYIAGLSPSLSLSLYVYLELNFIFYSFNKNSKTMSKTRVKFGRQVDLVFFRRIWEVLVECFSARHLRSGSWKKPNPMWPAGYDDQWTTVTSRPVMF